MLLQLFVDNTRLALPKTSLGFVFFYDVNQNLEKRRFLRFLALIYILANLLGNKSSSFVICDWWISIRFVRVSMGWWLLRLSAKILALLRVSVNFDQLRLTKKLNINFFCFKKLKIN